MGVLSNECRKEGGKWFLFCKMGHSRNLYDFQLIRSNWACMGSSAGKENPVLPWAWHWRSHKDSMWEELCLQFHQLTSFPACASIQPCSGAIPSTVKGMCLWLVTFCISLQKDMDWIAANSQLGKPCTVVFRRRDLTPKWHVVWAPTNFCFKLGGVLMN